MGAAELVQLLLAVLGGGTAVKLIDGLLNRRKGRAEAAAAEVDVAAKVEEIYGRMTEKQAVQIDVLERKISALEEKCAADTAELMAQVRQANADRDLANAAIAEFRQDAISAKTAARIAREVIVELQDRLDRLEAAA